MAVYCPPSRPANVADHEPALALTVIVSNASPASAVAPVNSSTVTCLPSPGATPATPETVSTPVVLSGAVSVTCGGTVSMANVELPLNPGVPARFSCSTWAVYVPSARCATGPTLQLDPLLATVSCCASSAD